MQYQLTVVLDGEASSAKKKAFQEKLEKILSLNDGKVVSLKDWGKKDLAYEIGKSQKGVFLHWEVELAPKSAKEVQSKLTVDPEVLRHLFVRA